MYVHLVLVTRYQDQVFAARHLEPVEQIMRDMCADFGCILAEFNGDPEHMHLLANFCPVPTGDQPQGVSS